MSHQKRRGHLKIYLGYAAGVGKTYQMLEDARELKARGVDVALAFLEPQGRGDLIERSKEFEMVPLLRVACRGSYTEEIDVAGILQRRAKVCIVDDLAHTNAPGSERQRRWQDVQVLLDGGVNVLTTMNVQDLASLSDQILQITGLRVRETVPDWVFQEADEVVMVDVTPRALLHRLERGVIYPPEKAKAEALLKATILEKLQQLPAGQLVMLKLTLPEQDNFYADFVKYPNVLRVVALSGGYSRDEANNRLRRNHGIIASFSRALAEGLSAQQSDAEFNAMLDKSIQSIFEASNT